MIGDNMDMVLDGLYSFLDDTFEETITEADYDQVYLDWWETEFRYMVYSRVLELIEEGKSLKVAIDIVMGDKEFIKDSLENTRSLAVFA